MQINACGVIIIDKIVCFDEISIDSIRFNIVSLGECFCFVIIPEVL